MVVIDFETTGLSPSRGDRATEIAAVLIENGEVVDRYQSLMKSGVRVPRYIESLDRALRTRCRQRPPSETVMQEVFEFVGEALMVAQRVVRLQIWGCRTLENWEVWSARACMLDVVVTPHFPWCTQSQAGRTRPVAHNCQLLGGFTAP